MANAGWYPDPAGQHGAFRYWNGTSWSAEVSSDPSGPPPGARPDPTAPASPASPAAPTAPASPASPAAPTAPAGAADGPHDAPTQVPGAVPPPASGNQPYGNQPYGNQPYGNQPYGNQPGGNQPGGHQPYGNQPTATPPGGSWTPQPAPPSWSSGPPAASSGGGGKGVALVVGVVVLVIALGVGTFFLVKGLGNGDDSAKGNGTTSSGDATSASTDDPTDDPSTDPTNDPSTDPTDDPTDDPSTDPSTGTIVADPNSPACVGGIPDQGGNLLVDDHLVGGGLSAEKAPRYYRRFKLGNSPNSYTQDGAFEFADDVTALSKLIDSSYVSGYSLGSLATSRGYTDPQQAAETALSCLEQSDNYTSPMREDTGSEAIDVEGAPGWKITSTISVDPSTNDSGITGDLVVIEVVDTGAADAFGLYVNYVPIGYQDFVKDQEQVTDSLQLAD